MAKVKRIVAKSSGRNFAMLLLGCLVEKFGRTHLAPRVKLTVWRGGLAGAESSALPEKNPSHNMLKVLRIYCFTHTCRKFSPSHLRNRVVANGYGFVFCETAKSFSSLPTTGSGGKSRAECKGADIVLQASEIRFWNGPPTGRTFAHCGMLSTDCEKRPWWFSPRRR